MVLSSMTHYDDKLVGGIDIVGISNFVSFLENTKEYRRDLRRVEYGDERDPEMRAFLTKISPVTNVSQISKPLLVVQGLNDPRVPVGESEQMVEPSTIAGPLPCRRRPRPPSAAIGGASNFADVHSQYEVQITQTCRIVTRSDRDIAGEATRPGGAHAIV